MKAIIYSLSAFLVLIVTSCNTQETVVGNGAESNNNQKTQSSENKTYERREINKTTINSEVRPISLPMPTEKNTNN